MPKFITIGYGNQQGYDRTPQELRDAAHAHDARLQQSGVLMGIVGVPVQVRNPEDNGVTSQNGSYMTAPLPLAGFAIIEANDMVEAIELVSKSPCAIAHGVVEVWPLTEAS